MSDRQPTPAPRLETPFALRPAPPTREQVVHIELAGLADAAAALAGEGARMVSMFVTGRGRREVVVTFALRGGITTLVAAAGTAASYPALAPRLPAAAWAEREIHDETGIVPAGHPDLRPLLGVDADALRSTVAGDDVFLLPYGPIRSGVFEAVQFVIETGGEDIPALEVRPGFKHRRMEARFAGVAVAHGVALAERVAGTSSVAHALAYCHAVERACDVNPPTRAQLWRAVHAELERIVHHLHVAAALAETTALSVGNARFAILKEDVQRMRAALCGSRFGRGVLVPGGIRSEPGMSVDGLRAAVDAFERDLRRDQRMLLGTTSFTDRLVGTGRLDRETVVRLAGVGPAARAAGVSTDARFERPYGAYPQVGFEVVTRDEGDAMARLEVQLGEIRQSLHIVRQIADRLPRTGAELCVPVPGATGGAHGWSEAPQGELVYSVAIERGMVAELHIAPPSYRNWPLFCASFRGDVLTDFGFIEHSFGLTAAEADR
jgi:formate hydrogenlyase subunit 5